ncbi:MAG TPA: hypothetical protein VL985_11020 [Stellaceae bacterium]|nr:hypothetical protein [Stellaceae bacterium]
MAFFGTGFLLLSGRPAEIVRSAEILRSKPPTIVAAAPLSRAATQAAAMLSPPPVGARERDVTRPPDKTDVAAAPTAFAPTAFAPTAPPPVGQLPVGELKTMPASSIAADKTAPIPLVRAPDADGVAARRPATSDVTASAVPAVPQPHQPGPSTVFSAPPVRAGPAPAQDNGGAADIATDPTSVEPLPAAEITALLVQGDDAYRRGDLASARLLYRRAYDAGDGHGALGIGASYDPLFLRQFRLWTQVSDPEEARLWYARARDLGAPQAADRLRRLSAKPSR